MKWTRLPDPLPNMTMWGKHENNWSIIMSYDADFKIWGVSAKRTPLSKRVDIGDHFPNRETAEAALDIWLKEHAHAS